MAAGFGVALVPELALGPNLHRAAVIDVTDVHLVREIALLTTAALDPRARAAILVTLSSLE